MTNPTPPALGRLTAVQPREVWPHEARNFTPWLLSNADVLADLLGMDLELHAAEHPVGGFSLDLIGRDAATDQVVIVENQLETSDHTHLGQILTYAAGTNPTTIVWVAPSFRPEHRAALDWLNARTDEHTRFFGVEIGVMRIGDSLPAPAFKLVAQPNDWEKTVRTATAQPGGGPKGALYQGFWEAFYAELAVRHPGWTRASGRSTSDFIGLNAGVPAVRFYIAFPKRGLQCSVTFEHPDPAVNTDRFAWMLERRQVIEGAYGGTLEFEDLATRKSTRIADYFPGADIESSTSWDEYRRWAIDRIGRLRKAFGAVGAIPPVRTLSVEDASTPALEL